MTSKMPEYRWDEKQFAPVAPISLLTELHKVGKAGWYHLLLAHDVLAHKKEYATLFQQKYSPEQDWFVIMDNSVVELGHPASKEDLYEAAQIVDARVIVLPDAYLNKKETLELTANALHEWGGIFEEMPSVELMIVPQGETFGDWMECAYELSFLAHQFVRICWWGIPRNFNKNLGMSRALAADLLHAIHPMNMHLLGFSDNTVDDIIACRHHKDVRGIDSAVPVREGSHHRVWWPERDDIPSRGDWWETYKDGVTEKMIANIDHAKELVRLR